MQNTGAARFLTGCGYLMMIVLIGLGGALGTIGIRELGEAREFSTPMTVSCAELIRRKPDHGWFRITDGVLDVEDVIWEETVAGNTIKRAFVPLFQANGSRAEKASIVVETKDPDVLRLVQEKREGPGRLPMNTDLQRTHFWVQRPVEGRVPGFNRPGMVARRMRDGGISWRLTAEYVYIAEGEAPSYQAGWTLIGAGAGLVALIAVFLVKMAQEQSAKR